MTAGSSLGRRVSEDPRDIPLLVLSFDGYADIWPVFFAFFRKNWPDCPFPVYLSTNVKTYEGPGVIALPTGPEVTWATRLRRALEALNSDYVLLVLEDFLFYERVDTAEVLRLARVALEERVGCLRLAPNPAPSRPVEGHEDLGVVLPDDPYRVTSQVAFWHVDTLLQFLDPSYSIWDFEFHASVHGPIPTRPMWARWKPAIVYRDCISRGRWMPWGIATCRTAGVPIDFDTRGRMTGSHLWRLYYGYARGLVFWALPRSVQRRRWRRIVARETARRKTG